MGDQDYLLLVEDEPVVQEYNKKILERRGYRIRQAFSLAEAKKVFAENPPRAIVLDIQLPDGNGLDFLRELRKTSNAPVLLLTAMGTHDDTVQGLKAGGDDYLPKPYDLDVFLTRVETLMRRASIVPDTLSIGRLRIEPMANKAMLDGEDLHLSSKEASLLAVFAQHPDTVLSADFLFQKVWGQDISGDENALRVAISRLRKKLKDSGYTIVVERSEGYVFERE